MIENRGLKNIFLLVYWAINRSEYKDKYFCEYHRKKELSSTPLLQTLGLSMIGLKRFYIQFYDFSVSCLDTEVSLDTKVEIILAAAILSLIVLLFTW